MKQLLFKDNLKSFRKERKLSQQQLADALHTTTKTLSHWETGYSEPSLSQLIEIADFFQVTIDELVR